VVNGSDSDPMERDLAQESMAGFRPLTSLEQEVLSVLLRTSFPGRDALVQQSIGATAKPVGNNGSLVFEPSHGAPAASDADGLPVEAEYADADRRPVYVLLHVYGGYLGALEVFRGDGERVERALPPHEFRVFVHGS
jgi:hypothetical protein